MSVRGRGGAWYGSAVTANAGSPDLVSPAGILAVFDDLVAEFTSAGWSKSSDATSEVDGGTTGTAMLDDGTWQVVLSVQVGVQDMPDSFSYLVSSAS